MTAIQAQRIVDKSLNTADAACRIQAAEQASVRRAMSLAAMLEWYGSDICAQMDHPSPAAFATAVRAIRAYHQQED